MTLETDTNLEDVARERVDESEPLQNKILKILTSKATSKLKGVSKWRDLLAGRTFRAPSALHYLSCTKSDNVHTLPLLKFHRAGGETKANSQDLVKRVVNCIQNRQMRRTEQLSALGTVAAESTNEVLDEITGLIREGHLEDIKGFLQQGKVMGSEECVRAEGTQAEFRRMPRFAEGTKALYKPEFEVEMLDIGAEGAKSLHKSEYEVNMAQESQERSKEQIISKSLRDALMKATGPKRTTRIRGQIALGK